MRPRSLLPILAAIVLAVPLSSCTAGGGGAEPAPLGTTTATTTTATTAAPVSDTADPPPTFPAVTPPETVIPPQTHVPPTDCEFAELDLVETELGAWLGSEVIPTTGAGAYFYIEELDNRFNPCAELSHVTLTGQNGGTGGPAGTGAAISATTVFFHYDHLITSPAPIEFSAVPSVERIDDSALEVVYSYPGGATAEGANGRLPIHYRMAQGQLSGDEQIPAEHRGNLRLDFTRAGPPAEGAPKPFGNAIFRPWDEELPASSQYSMAMGAEVINCDVPGFDGTVLTCYDEYGAPWPPAAGSPEAGANIARLNFRAPWEVTTGTGNPPAVKSDFPRLAENAVTRVGPFFFDTRSEVIKIHDVDFAYLLGEGIAEPVEVPSFQLDISRHPGDLIPWPG